MECYVSFIYECASQTWSFNRDTTMRDHEKEKKKKQIKNLILANYSSRATINLYLPKQWGSIRIDKE